MRLLCVLMIIFLFELAYSSEQDVYYKLHQSISLLEKVAAGSCEPHSAGLNELLMNTQKELDMANKTKNSRMSEFNPILDTAWSYFEKGSSLNDLENLRLKSHKIAKKLKLKHNDSWYKKIKNCDYTRSGSVFEKLGFRNGDVIKSEKRKRKGSTNNNRSKGLVRGESVTSPQQAMDLYNLLKNKKMDAKNIGDQPSEIN